MVYCEECGTKWLCKCNSVCYHGSCLEESHNNLARGASPFLKRRSRSLLKSTQKWLQFNKDLRWKY